MEILNLGCGTEKIEGALNVDIDPAVKPDIVFDIAKPWPISKQFDIIVMFHTIEHIPRVLHGEVLKHIYSHMHSDTRLYITYPEFELCVELWKTNHKGLRDFWEMTILGRGNTQFDHHVCLMHTPTFIQTLIGHGFEVVKHKKDPTDDYSTVVVCKKAKLFTYVDSLGRLYEGHN